MTITFITGFEIQQAASDDITLLGTAAYSTAQARTGAASIRCNPTSGNLGYVTFPPTTSLGIGFGLYIVSAPATVARVIAGNSSAVSLRLNPDRTIDYYQTTSLKGTSSALNLNQWYWISAVTGDLTSVPLMTIDGNTAITGSSVAGNYWGAVGASGTESTGIDIYIDDIVGDNGALIPPYKVDTALPTLAIGSISLSWLEGTGATESLMYMAIDNVPPSGVPSASETADSNVEAAASVGGDLIVDLETYSSLGITADDTVRAVRHLFRHGEDINTGTKNGTFTSTSNPATSPATAFTFGNDGGAHGAELGAWTTLFGSIVSNPTVTKANAPKMTITRPNESRVGCIDFVGMTVAWELAAAADLGVPGVSMARSGLV